MFGARVQRWSHEPHSRTVATMQLSTDMPARFTDQRWFFGPIRPFEVVRHAPRMAGGTGGPVLRRLAGRLGLMSPLTHLRPQQLWHGWNVGFRAPGIGFPWSGQGRKLPLIEHRSNDRTQPVPDLGRDCVNCWFWPKLGSPGKHDKRTLALSAIAAEVSFLTQPRAHTFGHRPPFTVHSKFLPR